MTRACLDKYWDMEDACSSPRLVSGGSSGYVWPSGVSRYPPSTKSRRSPWRAMKMRRAVGFGRCGVGLESATVAVVLFSEAEVVMAAAEAGEKGGKIEWAEAGLYGGSGTEGRLLYTTGWLAERGIVSPFVCDTPGTISIRINDSGAAWARWPKDIRVSRVINS